MLDDDDNKHEKRKEQQREQRRRRKILLILLTPCLFLLVWYVEHNERDAFYVREIDDDVFDPEDGKGGGGGWKRYAVPAHEEKEENECTIDRCHIRDLSLAKFNRKYREKKPVVVTFDTKFDEEEEEKNERESDFF
jgi:hypothetical protein